ncbi:hypothetical protein P154DRAFT_575626 [Amniculicola lignicola CBS 123094]|uniref:F-box domain-containing protein n=1 Tax=Amniculicola lignicola CBS 123094 TaxID=1392246 RepID=A0A6A5WGA2_9PLEO|nr:hypothetical protein P154DRAFT_575626 [Amniculicola lignicola CBS 123094]
MASRIPGLPVELIARILEFVTSMSTLKAAMLCSSQWHEIALPYLYRSINFTGGSYEAFPGNRTLRDLTVLFLRRPELAKHVRHFSIRPAFNDGSNRSDDSPEQSCEGKRTAFGNIEEELKSAIASASHDDMEQSKWLAAADVEDALLALLLPKLVNLQTLDLETPIIPHYIETMFNRVGLKQKPFDTTPAFTKLKSILWAHDDNKYGGNVVAAPFMLPSVQSIFMHRTGSEDDEGDDAPYIDMPDKTSSVTHLELKDCRLDTRMIEKMLAVPKQLKTFIYEVGWGHLSYCSISWPAIRRGLELQKDSLEELWWDYPHDGINWSDDTDDTSPVQSFRDFEKLRRVRIAPDYVFGLRPDGKSYKRLLDLLPRPVEFLHIVHGDEYGVTLETPISSEKAKMKTLYKSIEHLLAHKETALPALRHLTFDTSLKKIKEDGDKIANLVKLAQSSGVEMVLRNNFGDDKWALYDERVERKWGMDEDIVWGQCGSGCNSVPPYEVISLQ